jgi:hypothetical protein
MDLRENLLQKIQANVAQSALHPIATESSTYPNGREKISIAGM